MNIELFKCSLKASNMLAVQMSWNVLIVKQVWGWIKISVIPGIAQSARPIRWLFSMNRLTNLFTSHAIFWTNWSTNEPLQTTNHDSKIISQQTQDCFQLW